MAQGLGIRLVTPFTAPAVAALMQPEHQPAARLVLRESLQLNDVFDWPSRRFPPHGPPKTPREGYEVAARRLAALLDDSPPMLWDVLSYERVARAQEIWQSVAG